MSWLSKALNVATKIGGIAGKFRTYGGNVGKIASSISKVAGIASKILPKAAPIVNGAITAGKILYKSGIADKITHGGATRLVQGFRNTFGMNKNLNTATSIQS